MPLLARLRKLSAVVLCTAAAAVGLATPPALADPPAPPAVGDIGVFTADHGNGTSAVLGPDGNIWSNTTYFDYSAGIGPNGIEVFSPTTRDVVARYDVDGIITSMASGPDASVWFTENRIGPNGRQAEIGEISMSGTVTQHPLPASDGGDLVALAPDAAGNVWFTAGATFTDNSLGYVGYVAPNGTVTQYPMPALFNGTGYGHGMAAGANGLMWFIGTFRPDDGSDQVKVASVTPAGAITVYPMPELAATGGPASLTMGADGHPWFVLAGTPQPNSSPIGHYVGTVDDSGPHYYPLPSNFLQYDIAEGVDGNAYVSGYVPDGATDHAAVVAVSPTDQQSVQQSEFVGSDTTIPNQIIPVPGGDLWMTQGDTYSLLTLTKPNSTTMTLTSEANPSAYRQNGDMLAHLTPVQPGAPPVTGTVTFSMMIAGNPTVLATEPVVGDTAALPLALVPFQPAGPGVLDVPVFATYNGDSHYGPESSDEYRQTVTSATTTLSLSSTANPATTGQDVHLTATLAGQGGGRPESGCCTIAFTVDGGTYNAPLADDGTAVMDLPSLAAGSHAVTATFRGFYGFGSSSASMTQTVTVSDPCPCSVFPSTSTPTSPDSGDGSEVELGVKLRTTKPGNITGVRFYKSAANTGTHTGSLWTADGTLLATGTFIDETATGWQTLTFAHPVPVKPNTTYVASYHAPNGHYAGDASYFATTGAGTGPLTALPDSTAGGDGVYIYGSSGAFPFYSYNATNYWIDAVFDGAGVPTSPPTVTATTPTSSATGVATTTTATAAFSGPIDPTTLAFTLTDSTGATVPATAAYDAATDTAALTPTTQLPFSTGFTASVRGSDPWGQAMTAPSTWTFTTGATPPADNCPCTLFGPTATPAVADSGDGNSVELGTRFTSAVDGTVTGIRFYKGSLNTGTHSGTLWKSDGTLLASGTFTDETATGWQTLTFTTPVTITAGTAYVASYYVPNGNYSYDASYFGYPHTAYPLTALSGNGVYEYDGASTYPGRLSSGTNYWVEPVFQPDSTG